MTLQLKLNREFKDTDFMDVEERINFKELRAAGIITIFNIAFCTSEGCPREIPTTKKFCSLECKMLSEEEEEDEDDEEKW